MMGHTHLLLGALAGVAVATATGAPEPALIIGAAAGAALLPDIDHPHGSIRRRLGIVGHAGLFWLSHRGITHTLAALIAVAIAAAYFVPGDGLALAIVAGYASHLLADMATISGLPLLLPLTDRSLHLLPGPLRIRTGSAMEMIVALLIGAALGAAILY